MKTFWRISQILLLIFAIPFALLINPWVWAFVAWIVFWLVWELQQSYHINRAWQKLQESKSQ